LQKFNLKATSADPCVFISQTEKNKILLAIYIDDELIIAEDRDQINKILDELQKEFEITHNEVNLFLGLQIEREEFYSGSTWRMQTPWSFRPTHMTSWAPTFI
jgi:tetrahydromethanopterin S-methyltransferase subunit G